jgi:NADH-quinone oxidoreductase subunit A
MFFEYFPVFPFFFVLFFIFIILLIFASIFGAYFEKDREKLSSYECGFNAFGEAQIKFDVKFFVVGLLFLIFDVEIIFLLPWIVSISYINFYGIIAFIYFFCLIAVGIIYEIGKKVI